jgi:hypothetical protein
MTGSEGLKRWFRLVDLKRKASGEKRELKDG